MQAIVLPCLECNWLHKQHKRGTSKTDMSHPVLFPFSRNMGLMYAISGEGEGYMVDHSASLVLINPEGKITAIFKPEQVVGKMPIIDNDKLISDYQKIVALY